MAKKKKSRNYKTKKKERSEKVEKWYEENTQAVCENGEEKGVSEWKNRRQKIRENKVWEIKRRKKYGSL